jgi:hypothetical protein
MPAQKPVVNADDPQRRMVYHMEWREFIGNLRHTISCKDLRRATRKLAKAFSVPAPKLVFREERGCRAVYEPTSNTLKLGREHARNFYTLAHEFAHLVIWVRCGDRAQDHGPSWVTAYAQCLHVLRLMPPEAFFVVCRKYGVKYNRA